MTTYLVGVVVLVAVVTPPAVAAVVVRRRLLPGWAGPPALLVDMVLWAAQVTTVPAVLGAVGWFRRVPVVLGLIVVAFLLVGLSSRLRGVPSSTPASGPVERRSVIAAFVATALLTGPWIVVTWQAYRFGSTSYDSLDYHLPFAARWFESGNTWHVQQVVPGLVVPYHPLSGEILHALGMLAFHSDVLSPVLNLFWLAMLAVAAWCLGAPRGRAPHCLVLAMVVANSPLMVSSQLGAAMTDITVVAACVAAAAIFVQGVEMRRVAIPLGVALGLGLAVKLDALAIVAVLFIGALVVSAARDRLAVAVRVAVPALLVGGYWYLRDTFAVGNPLPGLNAGVFPKVKAPFETQGGFSVLHYATNISVIHTYFMSGLRNDFGPLWPLWLLVIAAGMVGVIVWPPSPAYRIVGIATVVTLIGYLATPTSAFGSEGHPLLFVYNVRYGMVALVLGAALLPVVPRLSARVAGQVLLGLGLLFAAATLIEHQSWPTGPAISVAWRPLGIAFSLGVAVLVLGACLVWRRSLVVLCAGVSLVAGLVGGELIQTHWIAGQYKPPGHLSPAMAWARTLHHARIGYIGLGISYPMTGVDNSNYVQYVGVMGAQHEFKNAPDCKSLRTAINQGRYGYFVISADYDTIAVSDRDSWIRGADGAIPVLTTHAASAYRLTHPLDPSTCKA